MVQPNFYPATILSPLAGTLSSDAPLRSYYMGREERLDDERRNYLREAGNLASQGNISGAVGAAFRGGDPTTAMNISNWDTTRRTQALNLLLEGAKRADTPERWAALVGSVERTFGPAMVQNYRDFNSRPAALTALEQAQLQLNQEQLRIARIQADTAERESLMQMHAGTQLFGPLPGAAQPSPSTALPLPGPAITPSMPPPAATMPSGLPGTSLGLSQQPPSAPAPTAPVPLPAAQPPVGTDYGAAPGRPSPLAVLGNMPPAQRSALLAPQQSYPPAIGGALNAAISSGVAANPSMIGGAIGRNLLGSAPAGAQTPAAPQAPAVPAAQPAAPVAPSTVDPLQDPLVRARASGLALPSPEAQPAIAPSAADSLQSAVAALPRAQRHAIMMLWLKRDYKGIADILTERDEEKAAAQERGKALGTAQANLPQVVQEATSMIRNIDDVINDPLRSSVTGWQGQEWWRNPQNPNLFGIQSLPVNPLTWLPSSPYRTTTRERIAQLQGQAFLQAYQRLRGAGQISQQEGARAEAAITRLANLGQDDEGYLQALNDARFEVWDLVNLGRRRANLSPVPYVPHQTDTRRMQRVSTREERDQLAPGTPYIDAETGEVGIRR